MSENLFASALQGLKEKAKMAAWRQWRALGATTSSAKPAGAIIDPEALVLLSLVLAEEEPRLWDLLGWWARVGSPLLSVQRIKNLAGAYPEAVRLKLGQFAHLAHSEGGDYRWKALARSQFARTIRLKKALGQQPTLTEPTALLLRLRAGFGVGIKADVLGFLLGFQGTWATAREITEATSYTSQAVRRALEDMAAARFLEVTRQTPAKYRVDPRGWMELLGIRGAPPVWRDWQPVFAFTGDLSEWAEGDASLKASPYLISSRARDLFERHQSAFRRNRIAVPDPRDYPGEKYLGAFEETLHALGEWMQEYV
jgi:hypothetical protein